MEEFKNSSYMAIPLILRPGAIETVKTIETLGKSVMKLKGIHLDNTRWLSVCSSFEVSAEEIKSKSRKRTKVYARQTICHLYDIETDLTLKEIGQLIGGRDHSTAIHSINAVRDRMDTDEEFKEKIKKLENR